MSNRRIGITLTAELEPSDDPVKVREKLLRQCKNAVKVAFGDKVEEEPESQESETLVEVF